MARHLFWHAEFVPTVIHFFPEFRVFQVSIAAGRESFLAAPETWAGKQNGVIDIKTHGKRLTTQQAVFNLCDGNPVNRCLLSQSGDVGTWI